MAARDIIVESIKVSDIFIAEGRRAVSDEAVKSLAASIQGIGLQHPITVRFVDHYVDPDEGELDGAYVLVAGRHRLEAVRSLSIESIDCKVVRWDARQARKWEIAENLHRSDLTELQRKEQIAEWIALDAEEPKAHVAPSRSGGRPDQGINAASRELGIERTEAQRAVKIASISEQARQAAVEAHLDNNQAALLKIAAAPREQQVAVVTQLAEAKVTKLDTDIRNRAAEEMAEAIVEHMPAALHGMMKENAWVCAKPLAIALTNLLGNGLMDRRQA